MEKVLVTIRVGKNYVSGSYSEDIRNGVIAEVGGTTNYCVLLCLYAYCNEDLQCFPSIKTIAENTGVSEKTVTRTLKDLEERGYITRELVKSTRGRQKHNLFTLHNVGTTVDDGEKETAAINDYRGGGHVVVIHNMVGLVMNHFRLEFQKAYGKLYLSEYHSLDLKYMDDIFMDCDDNFALVKEVIDTYIKESKEKGFTADIEYLRKHVYEYVRRIKYKPVEEEVIKIDEKDLPF